MTALDQFESDESLRTLFIVEDLAPWRARLRDTNSRDDRVAHLIDYLSRQYHAPSGTNILVRFLEVLRDTYDPVDWRHTALTQLLPQVAEVLRDAEHQPPGLTIRLTCTAPDRAEAAIGATLLGSFEPAALRIVPREGQTQQIPADPVAYGARLWAALGGEALAPHLDPLPQAPHPGSQVAIECDDPELLTIPWEYLHRGRHPDDYLILDHLFVRLIPGAPRPDHPPADQPWRLVVQDSDPLLQPVRNGAGHLIDYQPMPRLQVVRELARLRDLLHQLQPPPPLRWQQIAPTRAALIALAAKEPLLLHYTGHGTVVDGQPLLCFDDGMGRMDPQPAAPLARILRHRVHLACLNACRTTDSREPGANLALALVQGGVPVVLGTQYPVWDVAAALFAEIFYQHLALGQTPAQALYWARQALAERYRTSPAQWAIPALYQAASYTWPHWPPCDAPLSQAAEPPLRLEALPGPDQLVGRTQELVALATKIVLDGVQALTICGAGGMGKTALVKALAHRLRFHCTGGIYALSLVLPGEEAPLNGTAVRRDLASLLGVVNDPAFDDPDAAESQLHAILRAATARPRLLLIWDNYETVLWRLGRDRLPDERADLDADQYHQANQLQTLVRRLADANVLQLFTSRQSPVGLPGEARFPDLHQGGALEGLDLPPGIELFRHLARDRVPTLPDFPAQLVTHVGGSPLAIQLATTRWATYAGRDTDFLADLTTQLQQAQQDGVPFHQASIEVNVRLSINALPPTLRADFLTLTLVANPLILPMHGAVLWNLIEETPESTTYLSDQAHPRLEQLRAASLLQGLDYDEETHRAQAYQLQPVIAQVARHLAADPAHTPALDTARARYAAWADQVVWRGFGEGGVTHDPQVAQSTQRSLPDIVAALPALPPDRRGWAAWRAAWLLRHFGQPPEAAALLTLAHQTALATTDHELLSRVSQEQAEQRVLAGDLSAAMGLYQESLALYEQVGDLQGKAATLHNMAVVHETRGDLTQAMGLYEESLALKEQVGDLKGKSATLHQMAGVHETGGDLTQAMGLYQESLALLEQVGDLQGKSATLHQMAGVHVTRGDLTQAMGLYQESLALDEQVGNLQGKASTLIMLAQLQFEAGAREAALTNARESLRLFQQLGAPRETAQVREILSQLESRAVGGPEAPPSPTRHAGALVAAVSAALQGKQPRETVAAALAEGQPGAEEPLLAYLQALQAALQGAPNAAQSLLEAAGAVVAPGSPAEQADVYLGVVNVATELGEPAVALAAQQTAVAAQRAAGEDTQTLVHLSVMLYNLALQYQEQGDFAAAVPLLAEVVALDERTNHPDLDADRAALAAAQARAQGVSPLRLALDTWLAGAREAEGLAPLLNLICNEVVSALRDGTPQATHPLAADLQTLQAARPLPIPGAADFLDLLHLWLHHAPHLPPEAARLRALLPPDFAEAVAAMEQAITGAAPPTPAPPEESPTPEAEEMAALLAQLSPAEQVALAALSQVAQVAQQVAALLQDPRATAAIRADVARQVTAFAAQAAQDEPDGSPWLDAAALHLLAAHLRAEPVDLTPLPPPYQAFFAPLVDPQT